MKYLFLILISFPAIACNNFIPHSEMLKAIALEPNAGTITCAQLPEEECYCFDGINWEYAELVTEITQDDLGINVETKVLKQTEAKKAAYEASLQAIKDAEELVIADKEALKASCKEDIKTADTLEKLRSFYEKCFEVK